MGSRIGSITILIVIAVIVAAVVVIITRLGLLDSGQPDAAVMVVSLDDGELVLLDRPQSITVTISSGSPIATLELSVDDVNISEVIPPYSEDRGAWIGSFIWTPSRLGFADVKITALDAEGNQSIRQIQVEVTDDEARVEAALRVTVLGISPLQQFPVGASIRLELSATGNQPIERFDMLLNGNLEVSVIPQVDNTGRYAAAIDWQANRAGEFEVTIIAVDAAGQQESQTIPVIIVAPGDAAPSADDDAQQTADTSADEQDSSDAVADGLGRARIDFPTEGQQFTLDSDFELGVQLSARNVSAVASALLYITPVAPNGTLGNSTLIYSSEAAPEGDWSHTVGGVERFINSSGSYELQLVVFGPDDDRYDHRIRIQVIAVADGEQSAESEDEQGDQGDESDTPSTSDEIDIAIVTARQDELEPGTVNVTVTNASTVDIERTDVVITVIDSASGAELASAAVRLEIEPDGTVTIPIDLELAPSEAVQATILLESSIDTNTSNNSFQIELAAPALDDLEQQEQSDQSADSEPAGPAPDLEILDVLSTSDGYVLITIINNGEGPAETFFIVLTDADGAQLEAIGRRGADSQPLAPGATEILTSLEPHSGQITITVFAAGSPDDANPDNNMVVFDLPE